MKEPLVLKPCSTQKHQEPSSFVIRKYSLLNKDPYIDNSLFSKQFFHWGYKLIKLANLTSLKHEYLGQLKGSNMSKSLSSSIHLHWNQGTSTKGKSIFLTSLKANRCHFVLITIIFLLRNICRLLQVLSFHYYLQTFKKTTSRADLSYSSIQVGLTYLTFRLLEILLIGKSYEYQSFLGGTACAQLNCLIYNKIFRLSTNTLSAKCQTSEIVNYIQIDSEKLNKAMMCFQDILVIPYMIAFYCYLLYCYIKVSFAFVIGTLLVFFYLNYKMQGKMKQYQKECMALKDKRLKISTETFNIIKMLKLYCWDKLFQKRIIDSHENELAVLKKKFFITTISQVVGAVGPIVISVVSISSYQYFHNQFNIEDIFSCLNIFESLERHIRVLPMYINHLTDTLVSMSRLEKFLSQKEVSNKNVVRHDKEFDSKGIAIKIDNCSFSWDMPTESNVIVNEDIHSQLNALTPKLNETKASIKSSITPKTEKDQLKVHLQLKSNRDVGSLSNINVEIPKGQLVIILGEVGSGKSSLLQAILNRMNFSSKGKLYINGTISFVDQQPWIMNDTIRNNILFHREYDDERYHKVLNLCQLERDVKALLGNDLAEIGERGISLSGGQKVRVNFARALYREADIVLLDDITAALDAEIGEKIIKKCLLKFLQGKTRLFATNTLKYASYADWIIYMKNGVIAWQGTYAAFKEQPYHRITSKNDTMSGQSIFSEASSLMLFEKDREMKKITKDEVKEEGKISNKVKRIFLSASGGCCVFFLIGLLMFCVEGSKGVSNMWLEFWSKNQSFENNTKYFICYSLIGFSEAIFMYMYLSIHNSSSIKLSRTMHDSMISHLINASVTSFHETVPKGQIINRLSKDINQIDHNCMLSLTNYLCRSITFISSVAMCSIYQPYSLLFLPFLAVIGTLLTNFYLNCSRDLSRLDSSMRTPIISHVIETIDGLDTIRAYGLKEKYLNAYYEKIDNHMKIGFVALGTSQWFKLYLDLLCFSFFSFLITTTMLHPENYSIEGIGIILTYFIPIQFNLIKALSDKTEYESAMVNVERCLQYDTCSKEKHKKKHNDKKLKKQAWPRKGHIVFNDLSAQYRVNSEVILKNISFEIKPKEKIGIVGRTGSGKTTLALCLFRIIETMKGLITIDDIDISTIGLDFFRGRMTIIPQEPALIEGSLRYNIDPLNAFTDKEIIEVMKQVGFEYILKQSKDGLEQALNDSGSNLSVGEKQLVCITRAILKKSKIVLLDEATACIDYKTEEIIHKAIQDLFKESTVIIIAHRIKTILNCDKILVLDNGEIAQFETPNVLRQNKKGMFYKLYSKSFK